MKKTLLCLVALLLSVTMASAQGKIAIGSKVSGKAVSRTEALGVAPKDLVKSPVKKGQGVNKIAIDEGERLVGFYTSDDLDFSGNSSIGLTNYPGDLSAGAMFSSDMLTKAVGGQITKMRFGLACSIGATHVQILPIDLTAGTVGTPVAEADLASTAQGWNDVTFDTPVTIEAGVTYLVAYDYTQVSGQVDEAYPLLVDYKVCDNPQENGFMIYGDLNGYGYSSWYSMGSKYGNLCIQLVVKGGNYQDYDITLGKMSVGKYLNKKGEDAKLSYSYSISSTGNEIPSSYTLGVAVDGVEVETLTTPVAVSSKAQTLTGNITLGTDIGRHELSVYVKDINGTTPTAGTEDDKIVASYAIYDQTLARQKTLLEHFTSSTCGFCPNGYDMLNELTSLRNDIAWVSLHGTLDSKYPDPYETDDTYNLILSEIVDADGYLSYPNASFNRAYIDNSTYNSKQTLGITIGYKGTASQIAAMFNDIINEYANVPSLVSVNIDPTYNADTRELKIKVSGESVFNLSDDVVISVYLTEDGLISKQFSYTPSTHWETDFEHNHVFRCSVTDLFGDAINWNGDNYENDFTVTLDSSWKPENMNIVAFVSRPLENDKTDAWVTNAEVAKVVTGETGISNAVVDGETAVEVARYALDGTKLLQPTKGVNIVKMSDGTTKKVIVK